jgi:hypothetical protein
LPNGVLNNIRAAQVGVSPRSEKEAEVKYDAFQVGVAELNLKQAYLEVDNIDSLKIFAEKDSTLNGLFKLLEVLLAKGDLAEAQLCRSKIISKELPHISDYCKFLSTRLNLALAGKTWFDMDAAQKKLIQEIYDNNPATAIYARSVLALTKEFQYERYPFDIQQTHQMTQIPVENIIELNKVSSLKVYPNPVIDKTYVEINLAAEHGLQAELVIYNLLGDEVFKQIMVANKENIIIETESLNNGIYVFALKTTNGIVEKQKIIISK